MGVGVQQSGEGQGRSTKELGMERDGRCALVQVWVVLVVVVVVAQR